MKRIITILIAALALAACDEKTNTAEFSADAIYGTRWDGSLKVVEGGVAKNTSEVTLKFNTGDSGQLIQKRSGVSSKDVYEMSYSVSGKNISFDCPVISGTWSVSAYTEQAMTLTLQPGKQSVMTLFKN